MGSGEAEYPHGVDDHCEASDEHGSFVVFVVVEGSVADVLGPGIASETTHLLSTYYLLSIDSLRLGIDKWGSEVQYN